MGDPRLVLLLMPAAGLAPKADGGGLYVGYRFNKDPDPVVEAHLDYVAHLGRVYTGWRGCIGRFLSWIGKW